MSRRLLLRFSVRPTGWFFMGNVCVFGLWHAALPGYRQLHRCRARFPPGVVERRESNIGNGEPHVPRMGDMFRLRLDTCALAALKSRHTSRKMPARLPATLTIFSRAVRGSSRRSGRRCARQKRVRRRGSGPPDRACDGEWIARETVELSGERSGVAERNEQSARPLIPRVPGCRRRQRRVRTRTRRNRRR